MVEAPPLEALKQHEGRGVGLGELRELLQP